MRLAQDRNRSDPDGAVGVETERHEFTVDPDVHQ